MNILYHKLKKDHGSIAVGSRQLAGLIRYQTGRRYSPATIRWACYGKIGLRLALDIVRVMDFKLEDLRPDMANKQKEVL